MGDKAPRPTPSQKLTLAQLSPNSVVHEVARLISESVFPRGPPYGQFANLSQSILDHYLEMHLDPMILKADLDLLQPQTF